MSFVGSHVLIDSNSDMARQTRRNAYVQFFVAVPDIRQALEKEFRKILGVIKESPKP